MGQLCCRWAVPSAVQRKAGCGNEEVGWCNGNGQKSWVLLQSLSESLGESVHCLSTGKCPVHEKESTCSRAHGCQEPNRMTSSYRNFSFLCKARRLRITPRFGVDFVGKFAIEHLYRLSGGHGLLLHQTFSNPNCTPGILQGHARQVW